MLRKIAFALTTDGSGAAAATQSTSNIHGGVHSLFSIDYDGSALSGGTLSLTNPDGPNGSTTLFSLAAANVKSTYYPRTVEHSTAGVAATTTTFAIVNGSLTATIAGGGASRACNITVYLFEV